jgi:hypothetical protein
MPWNDILGRIMREEEGRDGGEGCLLALMADSHT